MAKKKQIEEKKGPNRIFTALGIFVLLILLTSIITGCTSLLLPSETEQQGNVAIIPVTGIIAIADSGFLGESIAHPDNIRKLVQKAEKDDKIEAIVFEVNSGGGAPVASSEIAALVKSTTKPSVAHIREVGASGAYWVASSADYVVANQISIVGSIGVIGSYLEFSGFLDDYNITYQRQVAGKYKDTGSPFKELTEEEQRLNQRLLDALHQIFISEVATNRNMSFEEVSPLSQGQVFLGFEAVELGLIDAVGGIVEVERHLELELGKEVTFVRYTEEKSFFESLATVQSNFGQEVGYGLGERLVSVEEQRGPMLR